MTRSNVPYMLRRVYERLTAGVGAIALTAFMLFVSDVHASVTEAVNVGPSVTIRYSQDALASDAGAAELYRKLKSAARKVCDSRGGPKTLELRVAARKCYEISLADAVSKVDRPLLSALHEAATTRRES